MWRIHTLLHPSLRSYLAGQDIFFPGVATGKLPVCFTQLTIISPNQNHGITKKRHKVEGGQIGKKKRVSGCGRGQKRAMGVCKHSILYICTKLMRPINYYYI